MARSLAQMLGADLGQIEVHTFPDGETYLRFHTELSSRTLILVCTLDRPNEKMLPLLFATARELGAAKISMVAPYLAYMRQDRRFKAGETVTSRQIAQLLSNAFDWLVTVDPHRRSAPSSLRFAQRNLPHPNPSCSRGSVDISMDQGACAKPADNRPRQRERAVGVRRRDWRGCSLDSLGKDPPRRSRR